MVTYYTVKYMLIFFHMPFILLFFCIFLAKNNILFDNEGSAIFHFFAVSQTNSTSSPL